MTMPSLATAAELIGTRRSIRRYTAQAVPQALVDELLAIAVTAPSAHNRQPWRFAVLRDGMLRARLADAMGERLRADRIADGDPAEAIAADVARSRARIGAAPVVVAVCTTLAQMDAYPDPRRAAAERLMAVQSTAMAVQNLLLAAHAAGLGACWMCAPLFCPDVVGQVLALPADWEPQALVTLGYPADAGKPLSRRPMIEVVRIIGAPA